MIGEENYAAFRYKRARITIKDKPIQRKLVTDDEIKNWQKKNGVEILCCTCGVTECGSPTVFIEKNEKFIGRL